MWCTIAHCARAGYLFLEMVALSFLPKVARCYVSIPLTLHHPTGGPECPFERASRRKSGNASRQQCREQILPQTPQHSARQSDVANGFAMSIIRHTIIFSCPAFGRWLFFRWSGDQKSVLRAKGDEFFLRNSINTTVSKSTVANRHRDTV